MVRTGSFGLSSREPCQNKHKNDLLLVACELWVGGFFQSLASCRLAAVLALLGGGDNLMGTTKSQNQGPSPPKPDTYDRYKVFCLKDHILSGKKKRGLSLITFWIFRHFWPIGSHWKKRNQPIKLMPNELLSID